MRSDDNQKSEIQNLKFSTRRHFFGQCGVGLGAIALNQLLARDGIAAPPAVAGGSTAAVGRGSPDPARKFDPANPLAPRAGHFAPKVKNVIYLFMAGAPSQLELF